MADQLAIWLDGRRVAVIDRQRGRLTMTYTAEALERFALGTPLLSMSLPLTGDRFPQGVVRAFLDGLLPEGEARRVIARAAGLRESDTFGLIELLGRDCAGALVIQPAEDADPPLATTRTAEPLSEEELEGLVANLRSAPLGAGGRVRISLAGVQEKLLLTRMPDGSWGRPVDGTPSTHILKPEVAAYSDTVGNEAFCMRVAWYLGLDVATVETAVIAGRKLIVVERYDRVVHTDGTVERLHQEDFCQATGTPPDRKYEDEGGPSLRRVARILQAAAPRESVEALLQATTLNALIGNGDAHAKNLSLLHTQPGTLRLSPLYDLMSTLLYGDQQLAMHVDDVRRIDRVTADRIVNEAVRWGIGRRRANELVADLLDRIPAAVEAARAQADGVPDTLLSLVDAQLTVLRSGRAPGDRLVRW